MLLMNVSNYLHLRIKAIGNVTEMPPTKGGIYFFNIVALHNREFHSDRQSIDLF